MNNNIYKGIESANQDNYTIFSKSNFMKNRLSGIITKSWLVGKHRFKKKYIVYKAIIFFVLRENIKKGSHIHFIFFNLSIFFKFILFF